jgi:hypothetical protein
VAGRAGGLYFRVGKWWSSEDEDGSTWGLAGESRFWVGVAEVVGLLSGLLGRGMVSQSSYFMSLEV